MGNSTSQRRVNSPAGSGLGLYLSYNEYLISFFKQKPIFIPKNSTPTGLTIIINDSLPINSKKFIVFPPLISLQLLYSAPGELWNWSHPQQLRDFLVTRTISARDGIVVPKSPDEITQSEEYTCVVSTKDGYTKMTHFYGNVVVDCHPIPTSMAATVLRGGGSHCPMYWGESSDGCPADEFLHRCYICGRENNQMSDPSMHMHKDGGLCNKECRNDELEVTVDINEDRSPDA